MSATKKTSARLRARLLKQRGISLRRWAAENGYAVATVYAAAAGTRRGPISRKIQEALRHG